MAVFGVFSERLRRGGTTLAAAAGLFSILQTPLPALTPTFVL